MFRVTRREDQRDFVLKKIPVADLNDASDAHTEVRSRVGWVAVSVASHVAWVPMPGAGTSILATPSHCRI